MGCMRTLLAGTTPLVRLTLATAATVALSVGTVAACGGPASEPVTPAPPPVESGPPPAAPSPADGSAGSAVVEALADAATAVTAPVAAPPPAESGTPGGPAGTVDECVALGRFPYAHTAADAGAGGPKTVVPWMVDPLGRSKPAGKGKAPKEDPLRSAFRQCYETAKKAEATESIGISFEHKPKGGEHSVCVRVVREEGKIDVTRQLARCMLDAIKADVAKH